MGLDATVRCRCFEEGKLKPGPLPLDDLYIDEEGYLSSHKLDAAHERLTYRQFDARYDNLQREFENWTDSCCEHEYGEYCSERVGNIAGCAQFESLVEDAGGEAEFPLLAKLLPHANGGTYPAEMVAATLEELDRFIEKIGDVDEWVLCDAESDTEIWTSTEKGSFPWMMGPYDEVRMTGGRVRFCMRGVHRWRQLTSSRFRLASWSRMVASRWRSSVWIRARRRRPLTPSGRRGHRRQSASSTSLQRRPRSSTKVSTGPRNAYGTYSLLLSRRATR